MYKMKQRKLFAALLSLVMLLTACGGGGGTTSEAPSGSGSEATSQSGEVKYADEVVIGVYGDTTTFDPHNGSGAPFIRMMKLEHTTLVEEDETTGELIPGIATSWELVDSLTWKFTFRDDIKFHNGELLTFEDIKFSFDRIDAGTRKDISYIDSLEQVDDTTFLVHLNEPFITFPVELTGTAFCIVSKDSTDDNVIGCGAYKLTDYMSGDHFTYERFDDYFKGTPKTQKLTFRIIPEDASRVIALETGEVDIIEEVAINDRARIAENSDLVLQESVMNSIEWIALNCKEGPTADVRVRQALAMATNKEEVIAGAYSGKGAVAHSILGSVMQNLIDVDFDYNVEEAKELLTEAGYPDGFTISLLCSGNREQMVAQVIQSQWKKIGVTVDIQPLDSTTRNDRYKQHNFEASLYSSNASNDEPLEFLEEAATEFGAGNRVDYSNARYDQLYSVITSTLEQPTRGDAIEEMQQIIGEESPFIPLAYPIDAQGMQKGVGGINLNIGRETIWYNIYKIVE